MLSEFIREEFILSRKGHWEKIDDCLGDRRCSNCKKQIPHEKIGDFCINCGADMRDDKVIK